MGGKGREGRGKRVGNGKGGRGHGAGGAVAGSFWARLFHSPAFKFVLIGLIVLLLLIPLFMVWGLVMERERNARNVRNEVAASWGREQNVTGPFLVVPFMKKEKSLVDGKPVVREIRRHAVFLPRRLEIGGEIKSKILHRSIYDVTVYDARLDISGRFDSPDFARLAPNATSILWNEAVLALGLSNVSGLKESAGLTLGTGRRIDFEPSPGVGGSHGMSGIHVRLFGPEEKVETMPAFAFSTSISFKGSSALRFAPAGRESIVKIKSDWPHPSFDGAFLPVKRKVGRDGFEAEWQVPHLARSIPQSWVGDSVLRTHPLDRFGRAMFGVKFYIPVDYYDLVNRALKYGLMFLLTGFAGVFVMELLSNRSVHGVQYVFVGLAMVFFFVMLLAFAEHVGFVKSYLLSSLLTGGMLSLYVGKIHHSREKGQIMLGLFLVVFGFLYMILRLEDYALLAGAVLGFIMLTATMFLTLRVDWSGMGQTRGGR